MNKFRDHFENVGKQILLITYAVGLLFILLYIKDLYNLVVQALYYLQPLWIGCGVAFVLNLPMVWIENFIEKHCAKLGWMQRCKRGIAITISVFLVVSMVILISLFVLPDLVNSVSTLFSNLGSYIENLESFMRQIAAKFGMKNDVAHTIGVEELLAGFGLDYRKIMNGLSEWLVGTGSGVLGNLLSAGSSFFNFIMASMIGFYLLAVKEVLLRQARMILYAFLSQRQADFVIENAAIVNDIFKNFVSTRFIDIIVLWGMMYILLSIFSFPYTLLLSSISALFTIVPVFGSLVADIVSIILLLALNPWYAFGYYVIHQVVLNIDSNLIYPRYAGKSVGLPAVWILVSVVVAGYVGGPLLMLLAVPIAACFYSLFSRYVKYRLQKKGILK